MKKSPIKFLVVDDQQIIRESLSEKLRYVFDDVIVEASGSCMECLQCLENFSPDLVFMDISMPEINGIQCVKLILSKYPEQKIIAFSMNDNDEMLNKMLKAGTRGYLLKTDNVQDTRTAVDQVLGGQVFISKNIKR